MSIKVRQPAQAPPWHLPIMASSTEKYSTHGQACALKTNTQHPTTSSIHTHSTLCAAGLLPILTALGQDEINNKPMGLFQWLHPEMAYE